MIDFYPVGGSSKGPPMCSMPVDGVFRTVLEQFGRDSGRIIDPYGSTRLTSDQVVLLARITLDSVSDPSVAQSERALARSLATGLERLGGMKSGVVAHGD